MASLVAASTLTTRYSAPQCGQRTGAGGGFDMDRTMPAENDSSKTQAAGRLSITAEGALS
jgi:hypothetical protein